MMARSDTLISAHRLGKTFRSRPFAKGFRALTEVNLEVGRGSVFGLLGPNGAGKTTFIKILLGLVRGWDGEAWLLGERAGKPVPRRRIGFLPEAHRLPGYLTGRQVLRLCGMYSGRSPRWLDERIPAWLERVGMTKDADRKIREFSKGMAQRIGLAQAFVHEPELVFLDEPTDGVDPIGRAAIRQIVLDLKGTGTTIFINSHLLMEVEKVCDRVVIMDRGRIIQEGTIAELTPPTGRVRFEVAAPPGTDVAGAIRGLGQGFRAEKDGFELDLDEAEQDQVVDRLRAAGIGIRSIEPRKLSLEEFFIRKIREGR
ncbi:MAG: ABC transporter ATP-binding protein [Planctomycetota bacterium]